VTTAPIWRPPASVRTAVQTKLTLSDVCAALSSRIYLPALGILLLAGLLMGLGWSSGWGGAAFAGSLTSLRIVVIGPFSLAALGIILVAERLWPAQERQLIARGHRHDLLIAILHVTLILPFVTALTLSFVEILRRLAPWLVVPKTNVVPGWLIVIVILVAMDGCNWGVHLANHRLQMLWRFHELHHSQEDMNALTVFRTHPLIHVSYLVALVPGILLLNNGAVSVAVLAVYGSIVAFAHSNTRLGFGPVGRIVVSPNFHRIHHKLDGPQDVNLGFALTIWDQIFHTAVFPTKDTVRIETGLRGRPLRVEQSTQCPRHLAVLGTQLLAPFRPIGDDRATMSSTGGEICSVPGPNSRQESLLSGRSLEFSLLPGCSRGVSS
jgi:sterol desaturase/sphingolipid hydroxylase (fatty acid hydroxylase superfamily)